MIRIAYRRALDWWLALPWYWKILGVLPLVGILLLGIVALFTRAPSHTITEVVRDDAARAELKIHEKRVEQAIIDKQRSIAVRLDATDLQNTEAVERLQTVMRAETMDELDELQKKWGL